MTAAALGRPCVGADSLLGVLQSLACGRRPAAAHSLELFVFFSEDARCEERVTR